MYRKYIIHLLTLALLFALVAFMLWRPGKSNSAPNWSVNYQTIGYFAQSYPPGGQVPRQGRFQPHQPAIIEVLPDYAQALHRLDDFDYIVVLFHMHKVTSWDAYTTPPGSDIRRGTFATRSPYRPNPIGMTVVRLDSIRGTRLYIQGADAYTHTPVLDLKPYIHRIDCVEGADTAIESTLGLPPVPSQKQ